MSEFSTPHDRWKTTDIVSEMEIIQEETDMSDRAMLLDSLLHDIYVSGKIWNTNGERSRMTADQDTEVFLQPSVSHATRSPDRGDFYDYHTLPAGYETDIPRYTVGNEQVFRLPQCYGVRVPRDEHPNIFLTMSECTALIGVTDEDLYAMHVGMSERGATQKFLSLLQGRGVAPENMYAVASVGRPQYYSETTPHYDFSKVKGADELTGLGIPQQNILSFEYMQDDSHGPLAGVVITGDFVSRYFFDEKNPSDMHDIVTLPFALTASGNATEK